MSQTKDSKSADDVDNTKKQVEERLAEATSSETLSDVATNEDKQEGDDGKSIDNVTATPDGQFDNDRSVPDDAGPM